MGSTGQSITLANSIIGVGILAMPFCYQQCGIVLATLILLFMGLVSRLCCYFLLKAALIARRRNFEFLAFHVFGPAGKLAVEVGIIGFLMGTCIAYFVVVGDLGPQIIAKMFNINQSDILRQENKETATQVFDYTAHSLDIELRHKNHKTIETFESHWTSIMVIVSLVCILPLGLLRNVDSLSNVSAATIGFYFCLVMKVTAEAASQIYLGEWQDRVAMWRPAGVLQCWPIFSMALFCQTQLFEIFESLPSLSLEKMNVVTKNAINICTGVYFTLGLFGYIAFSSQTISGNILMSLSPTMASDVIKLGFVMSVAFSFPLIIFPCRASLYSFLYKKVHASHHDHIINHSIPESSFRCITVAIIAVALFISLLIPNIELVLGLVGSTIGVLICVVFPAACFVKVTFKDTNERVLAKFTIVLGLVILVLGTFANLQAAEQQVDKYDDRYITQEKIDKIVEDFFEAKRMQKTDGVIVKPLSVNEDTPKRKNSEESNKIISDIGVKDSEVQPPNPVPPESQSNEKPQNLAPKKVKEKTKKIQKDSDIVITANKSELHPRKINPKSSVEVKQVTEKAEKQKVDAENTKVEDKAQEKIDMMKQQQLIETIKQHGEEQKELLEEQKEILHEIKKTKEELQQSKEKEINNEEAKKIAVESIQKIANMAIQSLSGVTDKPVDERPVKIANEAVQEIAKKAVESIVAIEDKLKVEKPAQINNIPNQNNNNQEKVINIPAASVDIPKQEIKNVLEHLSQNIPSNNIPVQSNVEPKILDNIVQDNVIQNNADAPINNGQGSVQNHNNPSDKKQEIPDQQKHSHSPDEPQSYKRGEDIQQQKNEDSKPFSKGIDQNVPLAVAMNANSQKAANLNENEKVNLLAPIPSNGLINKLPNDALNINDMPDQNVKNQGQIRQKREVVVDCADKNSLNPQDEQIIDVINPSKLEANTEAILSKVDLNDVLAKRIPIDSNAIHIGRSLKSIDESER